MRLYRQQMFWGVVVLLVFVMGGLFVVQIGSASETPQPTITPSQGRVYETGDLCFGQHYADA